DDLAARQTLAYTDGERQRESELQRRIAIVERRIEDLLAGKNPNPQAAAPLRRERDTLLLQLMQHQADLDNRYGPVSGQSYSRERIQSGMAPDTAFIAWLDLPGNPKGKEPGGSHWGVVLRSSGDPIWVRLPARNPNLGWVENDGKLPS